MSSHLQPNLNQADVAAVPHDEAEAPTPGDITVAGAGADHDEAQRRLDRFAELLASLAARGALAAAPSSAESPQEPHNTAQEAGIEGSE